jgi:short-subunit dehydrogenase
MTQANKAAMPFVMSAENAAARTLKGLKQGRFEIAFPRPTVWIMKFVRILPYWLYFWALRRFGTRKR